MGAETRISWANSTFSPWTGCKEVSEGCDNCYARALRKRFGHPEEWDGVRNRTSANYWRKPLAWDRAAAAEGTRRMVFCSSMSDVFEPGEQLDEYRRDLLALIRSTPNLDWLLLTKRVANGRRILTEWVEEDELLANVWFGASVETARQNYRIEQLRTAPAVVRFLSCEPLLGDLGEVDLCGIEWVIIGGESGPHARPMRAEWARRLVAQCQEQNVAVHFKQWGEFDEAGQRVGREKAGRVLDGRTWDEFPEVTS